MTISSTLRKAGPFVGNGVATSFTFSFKVFTTSDIVATLLAVATGVETTLTLTTDYTVSLNADQNTNPGGTVTYNPSGTPMASTHTLTLTSAVAQNQGTDIPNAGGFYPEVVEDALDKAVILIQQLSEIVNRTFRLPVSTTISAELPPPVAGGAGFGWNAAGTAIVNYVFQAGTSLVDLAASGGSALIGFLQAGVGAVVRTVQAKMREMLFPTPEDFGAVGNANYFKVADGLWYVDAGYVTPSTDDTAALQKWLTAIGTSYYAEVPLLAGAGFIPAKKYLFTSPLTQPDYSTIFGVAGKSCLVPSSALNGLVAFSAGRAAKLKDFTMAGDATTGCIAISYNATNPAKPTSTLCAFTQSHDVQVANFNGTSGGVLGTGFRLAYCDESQFYDCLASNCHYGYHFEQGDDLGGYPDDINMDNCRAIECTSEGFRVDTGYQLRINGGTARMCFNSGVLIGQTGLIRGGVTVLGAVEIDKIWTEQNWQSLGGAANGNFDIRVENGSRFSIRDHYCPASGGTYPLPLYVAACADFVIDNPNIANLAGGITIAASATNKGTITNLPLSLIGNIPTLISVGAGAIVSLPLLNSVGQYTATRATGVGTGAVGYTGGQAATVTLAATKAFTFTCEAGKAFIVVKSTGEACMVFGSYANATLTFLANPDGVGNFALTAAPGAGVIGISKAAASDVITITNGAAGGTYGISVSVVGGNVSAVTDPA